jgi:protein-tyrosine phosphatase
MWEYGVNTVIDLRSESEIAKNPSPFAPPDYGPRYLHLPLIDDGFAAAIAGTIGMADRYKLMVDHRQQAFGQTFTALARASGPAVFHCFAGKDRTGLVAAMLLSLAGVEEAAIAADYAETDEQLASRYAEWLAAAPHERLEAMRDEFRCPPEWMLGALEHVSQAWGSVEAYLASAGVEPSDMATLQARLAG